MQVHVMFTVHVDKGATTKQRKVFNEYLSRAGWTKLRLTTIWRAKWRGATPESAIGYTKKDVANAAAYAGLKAYEAVAHAWYALPTVGHRLSFEVVRKQNIATAVAFAPPGREARCDVPKSIIRMGRQIKQVRAKVRTSR